MQLDFWLVLIEEMISEGRTRGFRTRNLTRATEIPVLVAIPFQILLPFKLALKKRRVGKMRTTAFRPLRFRKGTHE